ncbi:hypothetical protein TSUD_139790 [Trifolium subterraneum]|uniref:ATP-dependent DNA helicase n=1 Tax=Trifolium subterraneum TaxID=3900 RepID=A0A2Z6NBH9_TRISU|nr:hypothetical protein TSUD_139790 [Trifolium subterraneum]
MSYEEIKCKARHTTIPEFQLCCHGGKAELPLLIEPPEPQQHLLFDRISPDSKNYQAHTRIYNSMLAFTSPGMQLNDQHLRGKGPPTLRIQGQVCHRIGSLLPEEGEQPKFAQLYIYDTDNEVKNRMNNFRNNKDLDEQIVKKLKSMLDQHNVHAKAFRMARDRLQNNQVQDLKLKLIADRKTDGRIYNKPTVSEVAAFIVVGFPDLFITFTCNPTWPEITRELNKNNLKPQERPDIVVKIFKMKFDLLLKDLTKRHVLGKVLAYMYTIEFQKRGLPYAHIIIFLHPSSKYPTPTDIDNIISAEIPNPEIDPDLYSLVKKHMLHGPCGQKHNNSPYMTTGRCSKFFPKDFNEETIVDKDGYPLYRRRSNSYTVEKNGVTLNNRNVVPYNRRLLLKYRTHMKMEWCNQSTSIKYLFKYIHKGYDHITASVVRSENQPIDEIKQYLDCRYISPTEACWRIYSYKIHGRKPSVERMFFHLVGENAIYFTDHDQMENILEKPSVTESMFTSWLQANQDFPSARKLTYGQFVTKFTYSKKNKVWTQRKRGFKIGRLIWVPPTTGELFYLRMMLTVVKGPTSYEDIKKVKDYQHLTFREACFAMGFLGDDKEYIGAIREAHGWGPDEQRKIFDEIMEAVDNQKGGVFFLHGYGGTGKTFMWRTLASALRSKQEIVLTVATSGIAALLLPGGRTAHSKFKLPVPTLDNSMCKTEHDSDLSNLFRATKLIIWDEAPMEHKYTFEALDRSLKDFMSAGSNSTEIFGGKVVVFGGDFRQILPVIPRGTRSDIVHSSLNASYIWDHCKVLTLTKSMRRKQGSTTEENKEIAAFSKWLFLVVEGKLSLMMQQLRLKFQKKF